MDRNRQRYRHGDGDVMRREKVRCWVMTLSQLHRLSVCDVSGMRRSRGSSSQERVSGCRLLHLMMLDQCLLVLLLHQVVLVGKLMLVLVLVLLELLPMDTTALSVQLIDTSTSNT